MKRLEVENVPEFMDWGPCSLVTGRPIASRKGEYFRAWISALQAIGFRLDWRVLCCADYGDPTTRRRFFLIGRSDRGPLEWPEATHARAGVTDLLGTRQKWRGAREVIDWTKTGASIFTRPKPLKPNTIRRILAGAVRYRWPQPYVDALQALMDGRAPRLVFSRAEAIAMGLATVDGAGLVLATASGGAARDLDQPLPTITTGGAGGARPGCARPQLVEPLIVMRTNSEGGRTSRPLDEPLPTICTSGGGFLADPLVVPLANTSGGAASRSVSDPIRTITTTKGGDQALAMPLVAPYYGGTSTAASVAEPVPSVTTKARFSPAEPLLMRASHGDSDGRDPGSRVLDLDAPLPTLTAAGGDISMAQPVVMRGNAGTGRTRDMRGADEPLATITTSESLAFALPVTHHGDARTHGMHEPLPTITGANRGELGLAMPAAAVADEVRIDINYRMLHWRELARATSFDDEGEIYDFAGNATEITKQIGNAVPNRTAKALAMALLRDAVPAAARTAA